MQFCSNLLAIRLGSHFYLMLRNSGFTAEKIADISSNNISSYLNTVINFGLLNQVILQ